MLPFIAGQVFSKDTALVWWVTGTNYQELGKGADMKYRVFTLSLLLLLIPMPALAENSTQIEVHHDDQQLFFSGFADEDKAFVDYLQVTAIGGDVDKFRFVTHDLRRHTGGGQIPRTRVKIAGDKTLRNGVPRVYVVTVGGVVEEPGIYTGKVEIQPIGQTQIAKRRIELKLKVEARPEVALEPEGFHLDLNLVTCREQLLRLDCILARPLLPGHPFQDDYPLQVRNKTNEEINITSTEPVLIEAEDDTRLDSDQIKLHETHTLPANKTDTMNLVFHRSAMTPGHYSGYVSLVMEDGLEPFRIPVDIRVRTGPVWATLALLVGVVAGQIGRLFDEQKQARKRGEDKWFYELFFKDVTLPGFLFKILAIIGAVIAGLVVVYGGQQGATWGANGIADALSIGAWGFAADLSSRGLLKYFKR